MANISFYPGPSRVYSNITEYVYEAYKDGVMSINHRSPEFMALAKKTKKTLRKKLAVPDDYRIVFLSSATECWEVIAQSVVQSRSQHFHNGAFGQKWLDYTRAIVTEVADRPFDIEEELPTDDLDLQADCLCVVSTETSNGTYVSGKVLKKLWKAKHEDQIVAIDATTSIGGIDLPWQFGDIWYASVQKCLGLPAGLGIMILSPAAVERVEAKGDNLRYNSLLRILENEEKHQAHYTPNVLGIYLLQRTQDFSSGIESIASKVSNRYNYWSTVIDGLKGFDHLVENEAVRARTVFAIKHADPEHVKEVAAEAGFILGNGYGAWKTSTFRIANFPALKKKELEGLRKFLQKNFN